MSKGLTLTFETWCLTSLLSLISVAKPLEQFNFRCLCEFCPFFLLFFNLSKDLTSKLMCVLAKRSHPHQFYWTLLLWDQGHHRLYFSFLCRTSHCIALRFVIYVCKCEATSGILLWSWKLGYSKLNQMECKIEIKIDPKNHKL